MRIEHKSFSGQLFREIKKKLWSGRREDPEINIGLNVDKVVFMEDLGSVLPGIIQRGKMVYQVKSNRMLDPFLGMNWDERILNPAGDFVYVIPLRNSKVMGRRNPITEYKIIGEQYIKSKTENSYFIAIQFVRGDGNRNNFQANM